MMTRMMRMMRMTRMTMTTKRATTRMTMTMSWSRPCVRAATFSTYVCASDPEVMVVAVVA